MDIATKKRGTVFQSGESAPFFFLYEAGNVRSGLENAADNHG